MTMEMVVTISGLITNCNDHELFDKLFIKKRYRYQNP